MNSSLSIDSILVSIFLLSTLVACQATEKQTGTQSEKPTLVTSVDGDLWGYIGSSNPQVKWTPAAIWAHPMKKYPGQIAVQMFGANSAPEDCFWDGDEVKHVFPDDVLEGDSVIFWVREKLATFPQEIKDFDLSFSKAGSGSSSITVPAKSQRLVIKSYSETEFAGYLKAENEDSQIGGNFTAKFCRK